VKRNMSRTVKEKQQQQTISLLDFETLQKTKISPHWRADPQWPVAARNDVTVKKVVSRLFQNL